MSVLRDAMELGYGTDHFMVTGENFPESWEDPVKKRRHPQSEYTEYIPLTRIQELNNLKSQGCIDTKEGWLSKNKIVCDNEEEYCLISGARYYNQYQTNLLSEVMDKKHSDIENQLDGFFSYMRASNITEEKELDGLFEGLESQILTELNEIRKILRKKCTATLPEQLDFLINV